MPYNHDMQHHGCSGSTVMTAPLPGSFGKLIHPFIAVEWKWTRFTELPHVNTKAPQVRWSFETSLPIARSSKKTNRLFKVKNKTTFIIIPTKILVSFQAGRLERKGFIFFVACFVLTGWASTDPMEVQFLWSQRQSCRKKCPFPLISWKVISVASEA